jgi:hypothetical protein
MQRAEQALRPPANHLDRILAVFCLILPRPDNVSPAFGFEWVPSISASCRRHGITLDRVHPLPVYAFAARRKSFLLSK